jgi:uncharacterized protein
MKIFLLLPIALLLVGCLSPNTSPEIQFYQLEGRPEKQAQSEAADNFPLTFLIVGPIATSPYLDNQKIALHTPPNGISYEHYHRWAEPLGDNIAEVISTNLRIAFSTAKISPTTPGLLLRTEHPRLLISISRFDADEEGMIRLKAQWAFVNIAKDSPHSDIQYRSYQVQAEGDSIEDKVAAMNSTITQLSADLAENLRKLFADKSPPEAF